MTPTLRDKIYAVGIAAAAVLLGYGVITQDEVPLWAALLFALLNLFTNSLAKKNVPNAPDSQELRDV